MASGSSSSSSSNAPVGKKVALSSALERNGLGSMDQKLAMAERCSHEGVCCWGKSCCCCDHCICNSNGIKIASVRILPWARANLNPTAHALIISTAAGATYFIVADKTLLASARKNSFERA